MAPESAGGPPTLQGEASHLTAADLVSSVIPVDDAGAQTADRYEWQAAMAAADGLRLYRDGLGDDGRLRPDCEDWILCEWQEDWIIISGEIVELVSGKHRDSSAGAYTTINKLADDGGLAHLFNRWAAMKERPLCRLVTSGGLAVGDPRQLLSAMTVLRDTKPHRLIMSDFEHRVVVGKLRVAINTYCEVTRKRWSGSGVSVVISDNDRDTEVARFLAALTINENQVQRDHVDYAAPRMFVQPVLDMMQVSASADAVWAAVLAVFRSRMRARGPLPLGELPTVLQRGYSFNGFPSDLARTLKARTVTMSDIEQAIRVAVALPDGYAQPRVPYTYLSVTAETSGSQQLLPNGFRPWPAAEVLFIGRAKELELALGRFRQRVVLPVYGPRYAGKSAFVRQLLAAPGVKESGPQEQPWLLLEITIVNASAESPVLEALATALEIRLQDVDQDTDLVDDPRRELVIDQLREHARGRTLLLVIDCGRLGYDSRQISGELDQLLAHPYFRDTANIVISRVDVSPNFHSDEQLDHQIPVRLAEFHPTEAAELLTALMAHERVSVDGDNVLSRIQDRRLRLPGVLNQSVKGYLGRIDRGAVTAPAPATVATALIEGTTPSVARTLQELNCCLAAGADALNGPEPLAVLAIWALADQLPLPQSVLEHPSVSFPRYTLALLEDARILFRTESGHFILGQTSEQALRNLVLAVLTRDQGQKDPLVQPIIAPDLLNALFPVELGIPELDRRLSVAASPLFTAAGVVDAEESADAVFRMMLRSVLGWIEDEGGERLPTLHEVIRPLVLAPAGDALYPPTSANDLVRSTVSDEEGKKVTALAMLYRLYHAVAALTLAARAEGPPSEVGARFVRAAEEFSATLAGCEPEQIPHSLLRSADASLALTAKRLRLRARLLSIRLAAVDVLLLRARQRGLGQAGRITLAVSWLLNTADALIDADRLDEARKLVGVADELVTEGLPQDDVPRNVHSRLQLNSRISLVRSRLLPDPVQGRRELLDAVRNVVSGLELAHERGEQRSLWSMRLFDSAILLLQQSSTDEEMIETRALVLDTLERCWGDRRSWPLRISISAARFLRKVHARCADSALKQNGSQEAVELLAQLLTASHGEIVGAGGMLQPLSEPGDGIPSLNNQDAGKVLSSLAQAYGFLARTLRENQRFSAARARLTKAEECASTAVNLAPTIFSYSVWLRQLHDIRLAASRTGAVSEEAEKRRRMCVKKVRSWLARRDTHSHAHALLDLTCLESDWLEEGSLRGAAQRPGEDFMRLHPAEQRRRIDAIYRERKQKLKAHAHRYGPSVELCTLETRLEREYCRWTSVLDFKVAKDEKKKGIGPGPATKAPQVDNSPIFAIFREAAALWPGDARLIAAEASFRRYIWDYEQAISLYEYLARTAPNGEIRRVARLSAAEAMLAEVEYATLDHRPDWHARLIEARAHLDAVLSPSELAVVLRERVAIRLGEPVNWAPIDAAFEAIVGGDYAGTVGRFLDHRHYGQNRSRDRVGDRVRITIKGGDEPSEQNRLKEMLGDFIDGHAERNGADGIAVRGADGTSPQPNTVDAFLSDEGLGQVTAELLGELLVTDFTSVQLLGGLGKLYLDRAVDLINRYQALHGAQPAPESSNAIEAAGHARRAYDTAAVDRDLV